MDKQQQFFVQNPNNECEIIMDDAIISVIDEQVQLLPSSVFTPYKASKGKLLSSKPPQRLLKAQTVYIVQTFKQCSNGKFNLNVPRVSLTKPNESKPQWNNGLDNEEGNLIVHVNDVLNERYIVRDLLGQGTFGQVFRCEDTQMNNKQVAVKIIKNKRAYVRQAKMEKQILQTLQVNFDPDDKHHIVRMLTHFEHMNHLCLVFEKLSINLFDLIKSNRFQGLSMNLIRVMTSQVLMTLKVLHKAKIIHCDLKPENILLTEQSPLIKVIDFGSACYENETTYMYIQSRFYRSPEVMLEMEYDTSIDMWSLGCICAELCLGLPLFPGVSQYNQLARMVEMLGYPPAVMIDMGKAAHKYFKPLPGMRTDVDPKSGESRYMFKTEQEYCLEQNSEPKVWKRYFNYTKLDELIVHYTYRHIKEQDRKKEEAYRYAFIDFLKGLLKYDPLERWTPEQASKHPFITGKEFTGPYIPEPDPIKEQAKQRRMLMFQQHFQKPQVIQNYFDAPSTVGTPQQATSLPRSMPRPTPNAYGGFPASLGPMPILGMTPRSMSFQNASLLGNTPSQQSPLTPSFMPQASPYGLTPGMSPPQGFVPTHVAMYPADQVLPQESRQRRGSNSQKSPQQKSPHQFVPYPSPQQYSPSYQPSAQQPSPQQGYPIGGKKNGKHKRRNSQQQQQFGSPASQGSLPSTPTTQGIPIPHYGSKPPRAPNSNPKKYPQYGTPTDTSPTDFYPSDAMGESLLTQELKQSTHKVPQQEDPYVQMQPQPKPNSYQYQYNQQLLYGLSPMSMSHMPQLGASLGTLNLGTSYPQNSPYGRGMMPPPQQAPSSYKGSKK